MGHEVDAVAGYYESPKGLATSAYLKTAIRNLWPDVRGQHVLGIGFTPPYQNLFDGEAASFVHAMPARLGATPHYSLKGQCAALCHSSSMPFPDESFDRILAVHGFEHVAKISRTLREAWRLLSPGGHVLLVLPNRSGLWARSNASPFGHGEPYSRGQITRVLEDNLLTPTAFDRALFLPPSQISTTALSAAVDRLGRRLWPQLSGVILIAAQKQMYGTDQPSFAKPKMVPVVSQPL